MSWPTSTLAAAACSSRSSSARSSPCRTSCGHRSRGRTGSCGMSASTARTSRAAARAPEGPDLLAMSRGAADSKTPVTEERDPGSFRDPAGFVFRRDGVVLRQVNRSFADRWEQLRSAGLIGDLQRRGLLIGHEEVEIDLAHEPDIAHAVLRPEPLAFVA